MAGYLDKPSDWVRNIIFLGFHVAVLVLLYFAGLPTWELVALTAGMYFVGMFIVTGFYHRYFSHRTYKTSRPVQFLMALSATLTLQKGVLWWAAHHRHHHRYSDEEQDVHSPVRRGFWWSHMGWIVSAEHEDTRWDQIKDFAKYPELRALNSNPVMIACFALMCAAFKFGVSFEAMVYGCFVTAILLWHGTFTINSLCHVWGKRVYATTDTSRNNFWLALITLGEGWHNNHHYYQTTARQGFRWWQIDVTYYLLWMLSKTGLVWDLRGVPKEVVEGSLGGRNWLIDEEHGRPDPAPVIPKPEPEKVAA